MIPIFPGNPNQIERELVELNQRCKATLDRTKQEGRLQLLIIILPDFKGRSYGKFLSSLNEITRFGCILLNKIVLFCR